MIRRDYILRMIEECVRALARIRSLKQDQQWTAAAETLDEEIKKLTGENALTVAQLSETELLALLMRDGPTQAVRDKALILTTLLKEAGDVAVAEHRAAASRDCYLKSLHLLLDTLARGDVFEFPEFVPKVEMLISALETDTLPIRTLAMLMPHYERSGEFARAEDNLFAMLDTGPGNAAIVELGISFYQRLLAQSDATLGAGNLPRPEVEEGLRELKNRRNRQAI